MERLETLGRAVLSAVDALDTAPDVPQAMQTELLLQRKTIPMWVVRLLVLTLLVPPLLVLLDALAAARRRRKPVGRWTLWTLSCALPFLTCALFAYVLGWLGIIGATPATPALPSALPFSARAATAVVAVGLTFALAWLLWRALLRRLSWERRPDPDVTGVPALLVLVAVATIVWLANPFTALLAVPALHLWLLLAGPHRLELGGRGRRALALSLVLAGVLPLVALMVFYAHQLGLGVGEVAWMGVLLLAGGHVGLAGGDPLERDLRLRRSRRDARDRAPALAGGAAGDRRRRRGDDPRAALLRRPRLARRHRVRSATIGATWSRSAARHRSQI